VKTSCEECGRSLPLDGEAYICSFECTFCSDCTSNKQKICPHCGGELVRRPRRGTPGNSDEELATEARIRNRPGMVWAASFGVWTFVSLAATATIYQLYRPIGEGRPLAVIAGMEFSQLLTYAPITPFAFWFAIRYPVQRNNWVKRSLQHLVASLLFTLAHIALKAGTPYGYWDPRYREWTWVVWDSHAHMFRSIWEIGASFKGLFLGSVVDDVTSAYVPIVLVALALSYYQRFRERETEATQLEAQLAKARLQTLKTQLQPHFLFNTLHSISALMLTDVHAADRMMSRLSDLLRISLETASTQITTLNSELEFVNCYLEIEKVRFEERLSVILDIAPETLDAQVPHLLLQPLVDNAVKHGISKLPEGGEIRITVRTQDGELYLEIKDNGPGLSSSGALSTSGLGLRVTRERLESLYGKDQSLEVLSPPEGGVTIGVRVPFRVPSGYGKHEAAVAEVGLAD
jgi:two-component system, LytTR family, sensor kinase